MTGLVLNFAQELFGVGDIFVAEDFDFCLGEARSVDDAGVIEFVGEDEVVFAQDGADGAGVGCKAGLEDNAGFDTFEGRNLFFELHVEAHGAGNGADSARAHAVLLRSGDGGLAQPGMVAEAKIIIGGQVDDALAVVSAHRGLLVVQNAQLEEGPSLTKVVELGGEMSKLRAGGGCGGHANNRKPSGAGQSLTQNQHLTKESNRNADKPSTKNEDDTMNFQNRGKTLATITMALLMLGGCKSKQDAALDTAKKQAAATGQAQQVVSTDKNGNVTTSTVQPPAPGQTSQAVTTTVTPAAGVAPNTPATAAGAPAQPAAPGQVDSSGEPIAAPPPNASGQPTGAPAPGEAPIVKPADVNIAAGTDLTIRINQHISVKSSRAGDRFDGEVVEPVLEANNSIAIPKGARVSGVVVESHRRGHFKGRSILELRLTYLMLNGTRYALDTRDLTRTKKGKGKRSAAFIGGGAGLGMLVGGVATGGVGLLVGGLVGGGGGAVLGGLTGNRDINIPAESIVRFRLADNLVVQPS